MDLGTEAPNADESYSTVKDEIWFLENYTTPAWSVTHANFPETNHGGQVCLQAVLEHEIGHTVKCTPIDPRKESPGPSLLRKHWILLTDELREERQYYAFGEPPNRMADISRIYTLPADRVEATDDLVDAGFYSRGTTAESLY
jgi:hypothetical protein